MTTATTNTQSTQNSSDKPILVIGGGVAGVAFIFNYRKLDKETPIILVEPKDYCELLWASYRSPFDSKVAKDSIIPLGPYCEEYNVQHLRTIVRSLTKDSTTLVDGVTIEFSATVVGTGANMKWSVAGNGLPKDKIQESREKRLIQMKEYGERMLKDGNDVVIIGGGLVGVELAGGECLYRIESCF